MILKKEQIANESIKCYLNLNTDTSKVIIGNKTDEINLISPKEVQSLDEYDIIANYLLRINKFLSFLKNKNIEYVNANIKIYVDNEKLIKIIKPDGYIIEKTSKELKKTIDNQRLKALLGITLQEISNYKNIDLVFNDFSLKEVGKMDNTNSNFELDINNSKDSLNFPEIDSLNYSEEDLFKEFDLNTENLFSEKKSEDFILEDSDIILSEYNDSNSSSINIDEHFIFENNEVNIENEIDINNNISIDEEKFDLNTDFFFESENNFIVDDNNANNEIIIEEDKNEIKYNESPNHDELIYKEESVLVYEDIKEESVLVYEDTKEESVLVYEDTKEELAPVYEDVKKDEFNLNSDTPSFITEKNTKPTKNVDSVANIKTNTNDTFNKRKDIKNKKEEPAMNKIYKENNKTLDIKDKFIQNELIEIKNILKNKINSYSDMIAELNSSYEEKHLALKDLNLTDEAQQITLFKEFLSCKSNMVNLKTLNDTCNDIISEIENKIFSIKK